MLIKIFQNVGMLFMSLLFLYVGALSLWAFITGVLLNKKTYKKSSWSGDGAEYVVISQILFVSWIIFMVCFFIYNNPIDIINDIPNNANDFKSELLSESKGFLHILFLIIFCVVILGIGVSGIYLICTLLWKLIQKIISIPFTKIKTHYRKFLKNIEKKDFINQYTGLLKLDSLKQKCTEFDSINSLPFDFKKEFFLPSNFFDRKREGEKFSDNRYKNLIEYTKDLDTWDKKIQINRGNYLNVFSNNFFSKTLLKYQFIFKYLYIPISILLFLIGFFYYENLYFLPIIYSISHYIFEKKYFKYFIPSKKHINDKLTFHFFLILCICLILSVFGGILETIFTLPKNQLLIDLVLILVVLIINIIGDLYDYYLEYYMRVIFNRILTNEKMFCFFYTLNCFEINLDVWIYNDDNNRGHRESFNTKFNPKIDYR